MRRVPGRSHSGRFQIFQYRVSYRRVLEIQVRLLSRVVSGELREYPGFETR